MANLKNKMKMFETMINTADDALAEELIAAEGIFGVFKALGLAK